MDGVIIHAEHIYRGESVLSVVCASLTAVVLLVIFLIETMRNFKKSSIYRWPWAVATAVYIIGAGALMVESINGAYTVNRDLIVTIDDSVSFNEFNDHYEILSQDGNLYTVREKPIEESDSTEAGDHE